ncbi:hypothetical protein TDB9533_00934 [Thalassocella blandensis]|nr:hypothetical protein TDB9533_00934 [Thalassocella blandensis]
MKGAVFIALNDMIERDYGIDVWERVLADVTPESQGIYVSAESYADQELADLVAAISQQLDLPQDQVLRTFGEYLFGALNAKFPIFTNIHQHIFSFLVSIQGVIHKEVNKLYHDASLPKISCNLIEKNVLDMHYSSPRKLCYLAEGLIYGAAKEFNSEISITQIKCCHQNDDECILRITNGKL